MSSNSLEDAIRGAPKRNSEAKANINMRLFWTFIAERQNIFVKRYLDRTPPPWTEDPILKEFKFTNVYRELDRGTVFYLEEIMAYLESTTIEDSERGRKGLFKKLVFQTLVYRHFNYIESWKVLLPYLLEADWLGMEKALIRQPRIYTNAHNVTGFQWAGSVSKIENSMYLVQSLWYNQLDKITDALWERRNDMGASWQYMVDHIGGLGGFTAYEVVVDLSYSSLTGYNDDDWVNPGPGCRRGLNRVFPGLGNNPSVCRDHIKLLRDNQNLYLESYGINFQQWMGKELTLRNIEHCLCEYSKYAKAYFREGRPRNKFTQCSPSEELTYA